MSEARFLRTHRRALVALLRCTLALASWLLVTPAMPVAAANTLHVTSCADSGANTLRGLIGTANVGDTIVFDQDCTLIEVLGTMTLTKNVTIDGTGHTVVVDGGCTANCGTVSAVGGVTAFFTALTIQHGHSTATYGGGIDNMGLLTVTNSTIAGNTAGGNGGGIRNSGGTVTVTNTIVAGNTAGGGPDLSGPIASGGHNLIGTTAGATMALGTGDLVNPTPLLGTLGSNGGPTQTIAHGDPAVCTQSGTGKVNSLDQRGVTRPITLCAIGALEPLLSAISLSSGSTSGGTTVTLTGAGFAAGATVSLGGVGCTTVQVVNSTTLRCTTGAHAAGAVDVVVTVGSAPGTLTGGYTYGVINPLPPPQPPGGTPGSPNPLPGSRPPGTTSGTAPNPLPAPRP